MNSLLHFLNQCSPAWWEYTLHATWQAALTAAILLGVAALGRKWPAPWRYGLLLVALLKFAVPPFLSVPFGAFSHLGPRMAASAPVNPAQPSTVVARGSDLALGAPAQAAPGLGLSLARPLAWSGFAAHTAKTPVRAGDPPGLRLHRTAWLMLLHLAGFAAMLAWVARQLSRLRGAVRLSRPMAEGPLHLMLSSLAVELRIKRIPALRVSDRLAAPVAFGVLHPTVLMPAMNLSRLSEQELKVILAHELAHVRRRDLWVNWAQLWLQAIWWFNPLLWMLNQAVRKAREDCCDDLLLARRVTSGDLYCDTLLRAAVEFGRPEPLTGALGFGERLHPMGRRFARILDPRLPRAYRLSAVGLALLLGMGFLLLPGVRSQSASLGRLAKAVGKAEAGGGVGVAPMETDSTHQAAAQARLPDSYEHFLYLRHDWAGGDAKSDSLVLVRVTRDGFDSRVVYSEFNLSVGWHPLGVCNRKLYAIKLGLLITVDLETGTAQEVDWSIDSCTWSDRRLYVFISQPGGPSWIPSLIRVYDAETEAYRDIATVPHPPVVGSLGRWPRVLQVSPDHKWLAYFCRSNSSAFSSTYQLRLVAVDGGTIKAPGISVEAMEFLAGGAPEADGPPFCWLDPKTLLVVRDVSKTHMSLPMLGAKAAPPFPTEAEMILARVDLDPDRITDICRLPPFELEYSAPFFRQVHKGEMPRLVLGRLGQYRTDLVERRLVEDAEIGGGYSYRRGKSADVADELRLEGKLLESGMVIQEVAVSPDERRVAWHARPTIRPVWDVDASKIRAHDTRPGEARTVAKESIPDAWDIWRPSFEGNLLWISTGDLTPVRQTSPPAGWKRFSPRPYPGWLHWTPR